MQSNAAMVVKTYSCGYPQDFGTSICYETAICFKYKHSDGGTGGGCSVVLVVSPLVSLINYGSHRRINSCHTASRISSLVISPHNNHV